MFTEASVSIEPSLLLDLSSNLLVGVGIFHYVVEVNTKIVPIVEQMA